MRVSDVTGGYPGVFIEEAAAALPPPIRGAVTPVAAFVGLLPFSEEESDAPFLAHSVREVQVRFPLSTDSRPQPALLHILADAFANGLTQAVVVPARRADDLPAALERLEACALPFSLLCLAEADTEDNPVLRAALLEDALAMCRRVRALLLLDAPAEWKTAQDVLENAEHIAAHPNAAMYFPRPFRTGNGDGTPARLESVVGAVAGVMARTDLHRGVWKAPTGTEATLVGFGALSITLTEHERGRINQLGINTLRGTTQNGRPVVGIWGARLLRAEVEAPPELRFIPTRRLTLFLEESIETGLAWTVFEPNDARLWERTRFSVENFLFDLWRQGAFAGNRPEHAFFVRCDATTMTDADIRGGVLRLMFGFAPLRPAEFVVRAVAIRAEPL